MEFPRSKQLLDLINEAIKTISRMGNQYQPMLAPLFVRALNNLESPVYRRDHRVLMLSVAQRCVDQAEKKVVAKIIGDEWVAGEEYSRLVRIRTICFISKGILNQNLQDAKKPLNSRVLD
jgi:hypothetical protein